MGPMEVRESALSWLSIPPGCLRRLFVAGVSGLLISPVGIFGQLAEVPVAHDRATTSQSASVVPAHSIQATRFLSGRMSTGDAPAARAMEAARQQHARMMAAQAASPLSNLNGTWEPLGPNQVASMAYGNVTGRVTSIAIDPADATGNTVYVGTTGGGVWKSTNAAGLRRA